MRNAFIRITHHNVVNEESKYHDYKPNEVVDYSFEQICHILKNWSETKQFTYYAIKHEADIDVNQEHYHIVITFNSPTKWDQIKKKFPLGDIERCKHGVPACVKYLVHLNDPDKTQYSWDSIIHNDPYGLDRFKNKNGLNTLDALLIKIGNGQIREYEITKYVDPIFYVKNRKKIESALDYFMHSQARKIDRNIKVFVFQGDARVGKTDMAKAYSYLKGYDAPCISGGSNDPWQFYQGNEVMILDDMRDNAFRLSDLLKIIDPYNNTPVPRRYSNSYFIGDYIIITTNKPIWDFYSGPDVADESRKALFARINRIIDFKKDKNSNDVTFHAIRYNINKDRFERSKTIYRYTSLRDLSNNEIEYLMEFAGEYDNPEDVFSLFELIEKTSTNKKIYFDDFAEGNYEVLPRTQTYLGWKAPESLTADSSQTKEEQEKQVDNYIWNPVDEDAF